MKVLATVDGSKCSEAILPQLHMIARLPDVEFTFLSIAAPPHETSRTLVLAAPVAAGLAAPGGTPVAVAPDNK